MLVMKRLGRIQALVLFLNVGPENGYIELEAFEGLQNPRIIFGKVSRYCF